MNLHLLRFASQRRLRAGVFLAAAAGAATALGIVAGVWSGAATAAPAQHPVAQAHVPDPWSPPADGAEDPDPECHSCPRHPIIVFPYPCATPVGGPTVPVPPGVPTLAPPPTPTPGGMASTLAYRVCPQTTGRIPPAVEVHAVAAPWEIYGYGMLRNPNTPYHPMWNSYRTWLSLRNPNVPHSRCNPVVWKAGCP